MTKYLYSGPFSSPPPSDKYRDNYDKVFRKVKLNRDCKNLGHVPSNPHPGTCAICEQEYSDE